MENKYNELVSLAKQMDDISLEQLIIWLRFCIEKNMKPIKEKKS